MKAFGLDEMRAPIEPGDHKHIGPVITIIGSAADALLVPVLVRLN